MSTGWLEFLGNHLWQSTLFAGMIFLLSLVLRTNRAQVRYWLWLTASVKFLVPFSLLVSAGSQIEWPSRSTVAPPISMTVEQISQPFTLGDSLPVRTAVLSPSRLSLAIPVIWLCGLLIVLGSWEIRRRRIHKTVLSASPLGLDAPIPVMSCPALLEPGVFRIFRPVLLLPQGIADRLSVTQFQAILAHELCHVRRRDNLAAAFHMLVEAAFWFHPLVWWIGARLVDERERACDEEVIHQGNEPHEYAQGILNVCRFYLESPLPCVAGITGADLKKRIECILTSHISTHLTFAKKVLLAIAFVGVLAGPIAVGVIRAAQDNPAISDKAELKFDVASIHRADPNERNVRIGPAPGGGGLNLVNVDLRTIVMFAYGVRRFQVSGGPDWVAKERFNILAKIEDSAPLDFKSATDGQREAHMNDLRERTRSLLAERFQLTVHRESKEGSVYTLVLAKGGPKMTESKDQTSGPQHMRINRGQMEADRASMPMLIGALSDMVGRPVIDRTGLAKNYDMKLNWTPEPDQQQKFGPGGPPLGSEPPPPPAADLGGPSLFTAVQDQLGLKLESSRGPLPLIVIDKAEKPSEN